MPKKCTECGGEIRRSSEPRLEEHKGVKLVVKMPDVLTCVRCGEQFLDSATAKAIDEAVERAYQKALHEQLDAALSVLTAYKPQHWFERVMGLSRGYVTKMRNPSYNLSTHLVRQFVLLAHAPKKRIKEMEAMYEQPIEVSPSDDVRLTT